MLIAGPDFYRCAICKIPCGLNQTCGFLCSSKLEDTLKKRRLRYEWENSDAPQQERAWVEAYATSKTKRDEPIESYNQFIYKWFDKGYPKAEAEIEAWRTPGAFLAAYSYYIYARSTAESVAYRYGRLRFGGDGPSEICRYLHDCDSSFPGGLYGEILRFIEPRRRGCDSED